MATRTRAAKQSWSSGLWSCTSDWCARDMSTIRSMRLCPRPCNKVTSLTAFRVCLQQDVLLRHLVPFLSVWGECRQAARRRLRWPMPPVLLVGVYCYSTDSGPQCTPWWRWLASNICRCVATHAGMQDIFPTIKVQTVTQCPLIASPVAEPLRCCRSLIWRRLSCCFLVCAVFASCRSCSCPWFACFFAGMTREDLRKQNK
jgi:hypothetical protein